MTVSNEHSINLVGIASVLQQKKDAPIVDYYFVVPSDLFANVKFKQFKFNGIPKNCNERYPYLPQNVNKSFCEALVSNKLRVWVAGVDLENDVVKTKTKANYHKYALN